MTETLFGLPTGVDAAIRLLIVVGVMTVVVMALIYLERKVLARFQQRLGPTRTGPMGLLQSVADALKLISKEDVRPKNADPWVFELAPFLVFVPTFLGFVAVPFTIAWQVRELELGLLYMLAVSSVNILGWVMAGWGSDNRYAILGALRAVAQSISYELPLVLAMRMIVAGTSGATFLRSGRVIVGTGRAAPQQPILPCTSRIEIAKLVSASTSGASIKNFVRTA